MILMKFLAGVFIVGAGCSLGSAGLIIGGVLLMWSEVKFV